MEQEEKYQKQRLANQFGIFDPDNIVKQKIVIVGCGGVGSTTAYALAQIGLKDITIIDFDEVENHNIASQFYKESQLGVTKVDALAQNIKEFTGIEVKTINDVYKPEYVKGADIIIMGVDNMGVRKDIVETATPNIGCIDCRMAGEMFELYVFNPVFDLEKYKSDWYSDEEATPIQCTVKAISYNCLCIASFVSKIVKDLLQKKEVRYNYAVDLINLNIG